MTEEQSAPTGAPPAGTLDLGDILGGPFRDPRALPKFLAGCLAVLCIALFGLGLLALLGYSFRTAQRAGRGEQHPMPEWEDLGGLLGDGLRVVGVVLGYLLPVFVLTIVVGVVAFIPLVGTLADVVLGPLTVVLSLLALVLLPVALAQMVATGELGSAFRIQDNLRLVQAHLGTYVVFLLIVILIEVLTTASAALCGIGLIPGLFWGYAAAGIAIGRVARGMGLEPRGENHPEPSSLA